MWVKVKNEIINLKHIWRVSIDRETMFFYLNNPSNLIFKIGIEGKTIHACDVFVTEDEFKKIVSNLLNFGPVIMDLLGETELAEKVGGTD